MVWGALLGRGREKPPGALEGTEGDAIALAPRTSWAWEATTLGGS